MSRIAADFAYTFTLAGHFPYPLPKIYNIWLFVSLPNLSFWLDRQFLAAVICRDYAWKAPKSSSLCTCILRPYQLVSVAVLFTIILVVPVQISIK